MVFTSQQRKYSCDCLRIREDLSLFFGAWNTRHEPMCLGLCGEALIGGIKLGQHYLLTKETLSQVVVHLHMIFSHWIVLFGTDNIIYIN